MRPPRPIFPLALYALMVGLGCDSQPQPQHEPDVPTDPPDAVGPSVKPSDSPSSTLREVIGRVEEGAGELAKRAAVKSGELSDWSQDKVNRFLEDLETYGPMLEEAGYQMASVRVRMGVVPAVTVVCRKLRRLDEEEQAKLLERFAQDRLKRLFLELLFRSDTVTLADHEARSVWITLSLNPHATVVLERSG